MNLRKAKELFKEEKWLWPFLYYLTPSERENFDGWIEQDVRSITFLDFSRLDLNQVSSCQPIAFDAPDKPGRTVELRVRYVVVYSQFSANASGWGAYDGYTVGQRITSLKEDPHFGYSRFIAVVREKVLSSAPSDFGDLLSFDIFKFPEGWQPPA